MKKFRMPKIYYIDQNGCKDLTPRLPELTPQQQKMLMMAGVTAVALIGSAAINPTFAKEISINAGETVMVMAQSSNEVVPASSGSIADAVRPLTKILTDLAEPVSYGFMTKGAIEYMAGKEHEGKKTIKAAAGGFLGVQFIPQVFRILKGINLG